MPLCCGQIVEALTWHAVQQGCEEDLHRNLTRLVVIHRVVQTENAVGRERDGVGLYLQLRHACGHWRRRLQGESSGRDDCIRCASI
eukprot:6182957-Pleurochrysis_carterae.AAC.1